MQDAAVQAKMIRLRLASVAAVCVVLLSRLGALGADPVDFNRQIKPLLESACVGCHWPQKVKGGLRLDTKDGTLKGGDNGPVIVAGQPDKSPLYTSTLLPAQPSPSRRR